ncbi:MAG: thioredoxin family protein [Alphaproteobacteria bacterium]
MAAAFALLALAGAAALVAWAERDDTAAADALGAVRPRQARGRARAAGVRDFTAAWCVTCIVNEKMVLTGDAWDAMKKKGIVAMKADWTRRDLVYALAALGRNGVPVYALYPPGDGARAAAADPHRSRGWSRRFPTTPTSGPADDAPFNPRETGEC